MELENEKNFTPSTDVTDAPDAPDAPDAEAAPAKPDKPPRLSAFLREYGYLAAAFLLPVLLMWLIYIAMEVFPFGDGSVLVLDLNGQYVYFFEGMRNILREGGTFLYSFSRALGGEFLGIYAYYLASPFSFLTALFPDGAMTEALLVMFLLKCGCCGVTFGYYIHRTRPNANRVATVLFSVMYALTAYAVVHQHNTMWIDCVIFLPLITLGVEQIIRRGRYKTFVLFLALAIISNFYIGFMVCIYVALYFFYYWFAHGEDGENNPLGERRHFGRTLLRMALYSATAVGIAAVIILTAYYSLTFGKTTFTDPSYTFTQQYDFLDIVTKLFPGSYDTVRPEGLPFLYCGVFTLIMAPVYFLCSKISAREKIASGVLLAVFILSFNGSTIDLFWHGMQRPNWLNCRYSFMFCFLLLVLGFKAYEHIREVRVPTLVAICAAYAGLLLVIQKLDYASMPDLDAIWLSLACVGVYLVFARGAIRAPSMNHATMMILVLVCLELFTAGLLNVIALNDDVYYSKRSSYTAFMARWQPAFDRLADYDSGFYRSEKTAHRKTNDAMTLDFNGLSNATSTLNASTIDFLAKMGLASKSHWAKYLGGTPVSDSLLGLKYILSDAVLPSLYETAFTVEGEEDDLPITAYYNPYALSLATAVSPDVASVRQEDYDNPFDFMNATVSGMLGRDVQLFVPIPLKSMTDDNVTISYVTGHKKYTADGTSGEPSLTFTFDAPDVPAQLYAYFATNYPYEANMRVNGTGNGTYFGNETMRVVSIGTKGQYSAGDEIEIQFVLNENVLYLSNKSSGYLYYLDEELFRAVMPELRQNGYEIAPGFSEDHFTGTITTTAERPTVFTSIPYDKGWRVTVDGEPVEVYETLDALLAFNVYTPGEHTLELRYLPDAFVIGMTVTVVSLLLFAAMWFLDCFLRARRRRALAAAGGDPAALDGVTVFPLPIRAVTPEEPATPDVPEEPEEPEEPDEPETPDEPDDARNGE